MPNGCTKRETGVSRAGGTYSTVEVRYRLTGERANDPEVDVILETDVGRVAAFEIKAASTVQAKDGRWLGQLRDKLERRFVAGLILHDARPSSSLTRTSEALGPRTQT